MPCALHYPIEVKRDMAYIKVNIPIISPKLVIRGITTLLGPIPILYESEARRKSSTKDEKIITKSVKPDMYKSVIRDGIATPVTNAPSIGHKSSNR